MSPGTRALLSGVVAFTVSTVVTSAVGRERWLALRIGVLTGSSTALATFVANRRLERAGPVGIGRETSGERDAT